MSNFNFLIITLAYDSVVNFQMNENQLFILAQLDLIPSAFCGINIIEQFSYFFI